MDLRQLEYFLAVVEHGGVNRAAEALHVAQPSLSQSVRRLERELGNPLFHRVGRGLVLAPAGEALVGPARLTLRAAAAAREAVETVGAGRGGAIDLAALADVSTDPLSIWVARFRARNPGVRFRIEERDDASDVAELVRSGACELGILAAPLPADLAGEPLVDQTFVLVTPPGTEDHWPDPTSASALQDAPLVMSGRGTSTRDWIEQSLRAEGVEPRVVVEVPQRGAVIPMVLAGAGAAIVSLRAAIDARQRGGVVRELTPGLSRSIGVVHRQAPLTTATQDFLAHVHRSVDAWRAGVAVQRAKGLTTVEAAGRVTAEADRRLRALNRADPQVRPTHP
ncbi:LysR substrate-binding domain-containing protein [Nocardioides panacihumi]|uniref:LysR substrate-binding domain-containing protein n=1 Tax=Nocardioides panacihumi TaxID=400774 RepID=A0ABN2QV03_9ACTN